MVQDHTPDAEIAGWLETLDTASLCSWALLVLYRHQSRLVGADDLARLLGDETELDVDALDALGLVGRSRILRRRVSTRASHRLSRRTKNTGPDAVWGGRETSCG